MTKEEIRNTLAVMERGKGIAYFRYNVWVTFNNQGEFNVFRSTQHIKHSTTKSLKEAVKYIQMALNN